MQIGAYKVSAVHTGFLWLDGGAMFGTIPKVLWEKKAPADALNRIQLAMRAMLIEGQGKKILVDCGLGDKGGEKFKEMFNVDQTTHNLETSLQAKGLSREDITDVILTHLHFDHSGGATMFNTQTQAWEPTFPNATYHLQAQNLKTAQIPNPREKASYLPENYQALVEDKKLKLWDGPAEFLPGIDLWVSDGHTEAQQHVIVSDAQTGVFYGGDLIPTQAHIPLAWIMGYDLHPMTMLEEKRQILHRVADKNWSIFFEHDPLIEGCGVVQGPRGFAPDKPVTY